ncbi:hypothetical protein MMC16_004681 [Acarospora aff. strigata]|nr:hypothetical protein [Acarospora aff. strigata]
MGNRVDIPIGTAGYGSRSTVPEPNPPFRFPATRDLCSPATAPPASYSERPMSSGNHNSLHARRPSRISTSALPAFDFHPKKSPSPIRSVTTPPESPIPNLSVPPRAGGHRRGGSEFIGGDGEAGGPGLMSTSPTKREGAMLIPAPRTALGPPAGRRGHSHRRSGAISSHDVSLILKPSEPKASPRSGSAPSTPSDPEVQMGSTSAHERLEEHPSPPARPSAASRRRESAPASGQVRARVGFSDTLEFIPRPLSIVSSETSSTMSPVQASHSVSGSITSLVSAGTASPPSAKHGRPTLSTTLEDEVRRPRPKTAGAVMTGINSGDSLLVDRKLSSQEGPLSASTSPNPLSVSESFSTFEPYPRNNLTPGDDARSMEISPNTTPAVECIDPISDRVFPESVEASESGLAGLTFPARPKVSPERRAPKKQKKVKSWAGSILSRKGRYRSQKQKTLGRRTPTPPLRSYVPANSSEDLDVNFDEDPTFVIRTPSTQMESAPRVQTNIADWKPREPSSSADAESMSPVIDLDAALGPFNTPSLGPHFRNALDRGFTSGKRAMHSSGATGGFVGPGMHYHRRAESAPEMVAFDVGHFGLHRLASISTMADVFEEDEEADEGVAETLKTGSSSTKDGQAEVEGLGIGVQVVDADVMSPTGELSWSWHDEGETQRGVKRKGSGLSDRERRRLVSAIQQGTSTGSLNSEAIVEESGNDEINPATDEPRTSVVSKSSDESTITPSLSCDPMIRRPASAPIDFAWPASDLQPATPVTISSTFSSPGFTNSSFDVPCVTTPSSSFTDRHTLNSFINGEPGPELRMSVDDVPSLTSSASTMTNAHPAGRFSSSAGTRSSAERSLSVSAVETTRTRPVNPGKRSSLASLSRLVGSSYGERSKLFMEEKAQPDNPAKAEKKKGNRISRLIHFWKSKEKLNPD